MRAVTKASVGTVKNKEFVLLNLILCVIFCTKFVETTEVSRLTDYFRLCSNSGLCLEILK